MTFRIQLIGILLIGSGVGYLDLGYGFLVIILGLLFISILEYWNFKKKNRKPPDEPDDIC